MAGCKTVAHLNTNRNQNAAIISTQPISYCKVLQTFKKEITTKPSKQKPSYRTNAGQVIPRNGRNSEQILPPRIQEIQATAFSEIRARGKNRTFLRRNDDSTEKVKSKQAGLGKMMEGKNKIILQGISLLGSAKRTEMAEKSIRGIKVRL